MTTPSSFAFTSQPDDCSLLDDTLSVLRPNDTPKASFGLAAAAALGRVLAPGWDGLQSPKGMEFRSRLIGETACFLINQPGTATPAILDALCGAIASMREDFADAAKAEAAIQKTINKASVVMTETVGYAGSRQGDGASAASIMSALIAVASPEQRRKLAPRILPPWQREAASAQFRDADAFVKVYDALFAHGCGLNDVFGFTPTPTQSVADQIKAKIDKMGQGCLRAQFAAEFDRHSIANALLAPLARGGDAWESKALPQDKMAELLALVELLEKAHPGRGADEALVQLRAHPSLQELATDAPDEAKAAGRSARI